MVGYAIGTAVLVLSGVVSGPVRVVLAAPFVGFLPGYAVLSALIPASDEDDGASLTTDRLRRPGLAWFERCSLSVAASVGLLPVLALGLTAIGLSLAVEVAVVALLGVIVLGVTVGLVRRGRMPTERRYAPPIDRWRAEVRWATDESRSGLDTALTVALVLTIAVAMAGVAYGLAAPQRGESYTEAALLTQQNDSLIAGNYTTSVGAGESIPVTLSIENQEGHRIDYTVVTVVERARTKGNGSGPDSFTILERRELQRTSVTVGDGAVERTDLRVNPRLIGDRLRLSFLVFAGDAPADPTGQRADAHLYLWVRVGPRPAGQPRLESPTGHSMASPSSGPAAEG